MRLTAERLPLSPYLPVRSSDSDSGRGYLQRGYPYGGGDRKGHEEAYVRPDQLRDRPPAFHDPGRGHDSVYGARKYYRTGKS